MKEIGCSVQGCIIHGGGISGSPFHVIRPEDVGHNYIWRRGVYTVVAVIEFQASDIGKRVYFCDGRTVIETDSMRRERQTMAVAFPRGGDLVRLVAPWEWGSLPLGSLGIIGGNTDEPHPEDVHICFHFSAYLGQEHAGGEYCSASGGPATIATPVAELKLLPGVIETARCWMWRDGMPRAHNGQDYTRECRVWEWRPSNKNA